MMVREIPEEVPDGVDPRVGAEWWITPRLTARRNSGRSPGLVNRPSFDPCDMLDTIREETDDDQRA
jgi:hypothetical protein